MPASLIQHFLCHPWHNISGFKHSSRSSVNHTHAKMRQWEPERTMTLQTWMQKLQWHVAEMQKSQLLLPWTTQHCFPVLRREPARSWHHWLHNLTLHGQPGAKGEAPTAHPHTCRHACTSSLQLYSKLTQTLKIINCKDTNLTKNWENTVELL